MNQEQHETPMHILVIQAVVTIAVVVALLVVLRIHGFIAMEDVPLQALEAAVHTVAE